MERQGIILFKLMKINSLWLLKEPNNKQLLFSQGDNFCKKLFRALLPFAGRLKKTACIVSDYS
jgi:hypothetical protein